MPLRCSRLEPEIRRVNARLAAWKLTSPFTRQALMELSPGAIDRALGDFRAGGLLDEGPAWTLKQANAVVLSQRVAKVIAGELRKAIDR